MALFKRRRKHGQKADLGSSSVTFTPELIETIRTWDGSMRSFGTLYRTLAPVRTVVDFLADAVATTSLKLYQRNERGRDEVRDHPAARVLRRPNPESTGMSLVGGTIRDLCVYSVAYWRKMQAPGVRFLVPLSPEFVTPGPGNILAPDYFNFWSQSSPVRIPRDEIVYFRLYHPQDRRIGASKLEALRSVLAEEIEVSQHRQNYWRNAARREGIIIRPYAEAGVVLPPMSDAAWTRFMAGWGSRTAGRANAGKTGFLEEGMDFKDTAFSPKDSEFVEGRKFILEACARAFNIPLSLLGLTETATYASQKEFHKALYQDVLPPWLQLIESELDLQVLPWVGEPADGDLYFEFEVESKLRGSFEEQAAIITTAVGRPWMEVAEARHFYNLPDRGDPNDSKLAVPINNVSLEGPGDAPPAPAAPPTPLRAASRALSLKAALDRQQRSVLSAVGAGQEFDVERWNRELAGTLAEWEDAG